MSSPENLELFILASGSKGNAALVGVPQNYILIDCGITRRDMIERSAALGVSLEDISAIVISHTHSDHVKGLAVLLRHLKKTMGKIPPIFCAEASRMKLMSPKDFEGFGELPLRSLGKGFALPVARDSAGVSRRDSFEPFVRVRAFHTSHDSSPSFGFRFDLCTFEQVGEARTTKTLDSIAWMTDTGIVPDEAYEMFAQCRVMGIESNHDPLMLKTCDYPFALKERIRSDWGHLSNEQADEFLMRMIHPGLEHVVALHISENSNMFYYPQEHFTRVLSEAGSQAQVHVGKPRTPIAIR